MSDKIEERHGLVRLITTENVFVTLEDGSEARVSPKDWKTKPKTGQRVVIVKKAGTPYDHAGKPNANLRRVLS